MKTTTALLLVLLLVPAEALAQQEAGTPDISRSFAELERSQVLKEGDTVWILADLAGTGAFEELKASFEALAGTTVRVSVDAAPSANPGAVTALQDGRYGIALSEARVRQIDAEFGDPLGNGILIGAVVGFSIIAVPTVIYITTCEGFCFGVGGSTLVAVIGTTSVGALLGAVFDASIRTREAVFRAPGLPADVAISFAPLVSRDRKGLLLTFNW